MIQNTNNRKERMFMRKTHILLVFMLLMALPMHSQVFMTQDELNKDRSQKWEDAGLVVPIHEKDFKQTAKGTAEEEEEDDYTPMGSGLAMLAVLGGAYLLSKKHNEKE